MKKLLVLATVAALCGPAFVEAQEYRHHHWRDREERLARIDALVRDCESRTDTFKSSLRRALDHSRMDGSYREHRLNADARRLEEAMNVVRDAWNHDRDVDRAKRHVRDAIFAGRDIERAMPKFYLRSYIESDWRMLRSELNRLADIFDVSGIEGERY
jgi:hypothetical protein